MSGIQLNLCIETVQIVRLLVCSIDTVTMPVDSPIDSNKSNVKLSDVEQGDTVTVGWISRSSGETGEFTVDVKRVSKFGGGTELTMSRSTKVYGDHHPPVVKIPDGRELRLNYIQKE